MKYILKILNYLKKYKWKILLTSLIIFLTNVCYIFTGYLNGAAIEAIVNKNLSVSLKFLGIYFFLSIVADLVNRIAYFVLSKMQIRISRTLGYDTYKKVMNLPASAFEKMSSGEIINRLTGDTEVIVGSIDQLIATISSVVCAIIILVYIFFNSCLIGLEILLFLILYFFVVKYYSEVFKRTHEATKKENDKFTSLCSESVRGIREIKTLGIAQNLYASVANIIRVLYDKTIKQYKAGRNYDIISNFMKATLECGVLITCAILTYQEQITITFFVAMTYYIYRYTWLIENVREFSKTYEGLSVSLKRIVELLNNELFADVTFGNKDLPDIKGIIEFKNVTFGYENEDVLLDNFNIKFMPNKKIAIVGSSGEGKSTLFNLITRLFDPNKGEILLDDTNIKELTENSLRKHISIIRQEPFIFNRTIKENFELIDSKVTEEEIRKYTKIASIDDYIMSLPQKYDTILGEGGVNLSGGQKQRLSIARTLLKESKIILFDEATSALDNESQGYIKSAIDTLVKDHTVLIVAHRLSTIIDADIIYVIKNGKVYDVGTHDELMQRCDFYQNLYSLESKTI